MEEAYKNWKLLLQSEDADNVVLALNITSGLEIDKTTIELDVLAAYFYFITKNIYAAEIAYFVDWSKKSGIRLPETKDVKNMGGYGRTFNVMDKVSALNPHLQPITVYKHTLLLYRGLFSSFIEMGNHERLDSDSWLACFKKHNLYREENNKVHVSCNCKKMPDIVFSWHTITHLYLDDYKLYDEKNIALLYQLKNLEELRLYNLEMFRSMPLDLNQFPKLQKVSFHCKAGNIFRISKGDYLKVLNLYSIDEETLDNLLTYTPNLKSLTIYKYKGDKLPESISQLQHLEELSMREVNKYIDLSRLKNLPKLSVLNLQSSRFRQLPPLANLVNLNISYCDLDALPFVLVKMPLLQQLDINNNRILFFKPTIIRQLLLQLKILNVEAAFVSEKAADEIMQIAAEVGSQTSINPPKQRG